MTDREKLEWICLQLATRSERLVQGEKSFEFGERRFIFNRDGTLNRIEEYAELKEAWHAE